VEVLGELVGIEPHLTPRQALKRMKAMKDDDGSLMFCWSKRGEVQKYAKKSHEYKNWEGCSMCGLKPCTGCNGRCLSAEEIKTEFSYLAKKEHKGKKKNT